MQGTYALVSQVPVTRVTILWKAQIQQFLSRVRYEIVGSLGAKMPRLLLLAALAGLEPEPRSSACLCLPGVSRLGVCFPHGRRDIVGETKSPA